MIMAQEIMLVVVVQPTELGLVNHSSHDSFMVITRTEDLAKRTSGVGGVTNLDTTAQGVRIGLVVGQEFEVVQTSVIAGADTGFRRRKHARGSLTQRRGAGGRCIRGLGNRFPVQ